MHLLIRRAFAAKFEWLRLVRLAAVLGGMSAAGDLLLPTHGLVGFVSRVAVLAAIPFVLLATGFAHRAELEQARALIIRGLRARRGKAAGEPA
jgi:hypothetical protein